jgi:phage recombination protein Bet
MPIEFSPEELKAIRDEQCKGASDSQFINFIREAKTRNLIPGRHLYFQLRTAKEYDETLHTSTYVKKAIHLTSIDFFRLTAQRTGEYQGQKRPVWLYKSVIQNNESGFWKSEVPLPEQIPYAVEVSVFRKGFLEPLTVTARFDAYAVYYKDGNSYKLNTMWEKRGPEMLAKCGEALALRQAFPEELGGLYIAEEIRDESPETVASDSPTVAPPVASPSGVSTETNPHSTGVPKAIIPPELAPFKLGDEPGVTAIISGFKDYESNKETSDFVTKEERAAFVNRLRYYMKNILPKVGVQNADEVLKAFVQKFTGKENTKDYTKTEWNKVLAALDAAKESGKLVELVTF